MTSESSLKGKTWEEIYGEEGAIKRRKNWSERIDKEKVKDLFLNKKYTRGEIVKYFKSSYKMISGILNSFGITKINKYPLTETHKKNIGNGIKGKNTGTLEERHGVKKANIIKDKIRRNTIKQHMKGFPQTNTSIEIRMQKLLDKNQIKYLHPFNFNDKFACDFALVEKKIIIECDGDYWHNREDIKNRDKSKNAYIKACGWKMLRFWESDINNNINEVEKRIIPNL